MKIITYNVNGIRAALGRGLAEWLQAGDFDVICVQEIKAEPAQLNLEIFEKIGYNTYWYPAEKKGYSGVAIFSKVKPDRVETGSGNPEFDREGRVIRADYGDLSIFSIYFPSGTTGEIRQAVKYKFLEFIYDYLHEIKKTGRKMIVCGDYNICHKPIDIHDPAGNKNSSGFLPDERAWMDKYFLSGFIDGFRLFNKEPHQYSWWSYRANARTNNKGWRIDYISITENLISQIKSAAIYPDAIHSDHCPVMLEVEF